MKPVFHHRPVNGPFEDPVVYVRILHGPGGMLFDAGDISRLNMREILKTRHIFITHMHIDHFIGFDTILRALLKREEPVTIYGPEGLIRCMEGKLNGYTWNLIADYPLALRAVEVREGMKEQAIFRAGNRFAKEAEGVSQFNGTVLENDLLTVRAAILDHEIPSLGYRLEERFHINIDKPRLIEFGLQVGPWLTGFKSAIRSGDTDAMMDTGSGIYRVSDLSGIYRLSAGQKISYIMDSSPTEANISAIAGLIQGSDTLYIEAYFLEEDRRYAEERKHLTARLAGEIARKAGVKWIQLLHFSPRYTENPEALVNEALDAFTR